MMREVAAEKKVATQMGNQGTSGGGLRRGVEYIRAGAIGDVLEVYTWTNRPVWPQGLDAVFNKHSGVKNALHGPLAGGVVSAPIRDTLAWDLWLGPAPARPYDPVYLPFNWRGWFDFGTGALGDMACHTMNLPFMALKISAPATVEAAVSCLNPETYPEWSIFTYTVPAREGMKPLTWYWFDGRENSPRHFRRQLESSKVSVAGKAPIEIWGNRKPSGSGSLMVGTKGMMYSPGDYGGKWELMPKESFAGYQGPPETLPRSPGHHKEWVAAIRGGPPAMSNFSYGGPLTEFANLGVVAMRAQSTIEWDTKNFVITNNRNANRYLHRDYRKGWTL
jgi:predicted dehydrogenase